MKIECLRAKIKLTTFPNPGIFGSKHSVRLCYHRNYHRMGCCTFHGNAFVVIEPDDRQPIRSKCPCMRDIMLQGSITMLIP